MAMRKKIFFFKTQITGIQRKKDRLIPSFIISNFKNNYLILKRLNPAFFHCSAPTRIGIGV